MPGGGPPAPGTRQVEAEMRDRLRDLEDLRRSLGRDRELTRGLDQAIEALRQMTNAQYKDDTQTAVLLKSQVVSDSRCRDGAQPPPASEAREEQPAIVRSRRGP